jgi:6-phosphogluconolactonase
MTRDLVVEVNPVALADVVAEHFLTRVAAAQGRGEVPDVVLTGGTVAHLVHQEIAARAEHHDVDWDRVVFWFGDERFVGRGDPDRNAVQARADLLDVVGATRVHEVPSRDDVASVEEAAAVYGDLVRGEGSGVFDLVMLGMGPDGHVASLFPGFPQLAVDDTVAVAVTGSPKPPPERVSLTFGALNRARAVWFLVTGEEKSAATARAWAFDGTVTETPARGIEGPSVTWYVDEAAAGE